MIRFRDEEIFRKYFLVLLLSNLDEGFWDAVIATTDGIHQNQTANEFEQPSELCPSIWMFNLDIQMSKTARRLFE